MANNSKSKELQSRFRLCVLANIASIFLMFGSAVLVGYLSRRFHGVPVEDLGNDWLVSSYVGATRVALFVGLPAFILAFAGLMRFKLWARRLFTFLMIAWGFQAVAFGIVNLSLTWGLSGLFAKLALLTAGAVLAMSYLTPIAELFASSGRVSGSRKTTQYSPA